MTSFARLLREPLVHFLLFGAALFLFYDVVGDDQGQRDRKIVVTAAEQERLAERGLTGVRLSCQIAVEADMTVRAISRLEGSGRADAGPTPAATITPPPEWV